MAHSRNSQGGELQNGARENCLDKIRNVGYMYSLTRNRRAWPAARRGEVAPLFETSPPTTCRANWEADEDFLIFSVVTH